MIWLSALAGFLAYPLLFRLLLPGLGILWRAGRDTCKWRRRHLKPGFSVLWLAVYYPVIFWDCLKDQWAAHWGGWETESRPVEQDRA